MVSDTLGVEVVQTIAFPDQAPGTSGLRKKTKVFSQKHYLENFVQSIFDALPAEELSGSTLVLAGDGRYFSRQAGQTIIRMAAANGVSKMVVATNFLMSTPGVSAVIRSLKAYGGIVMTASHNPGGPDNDFGVKYNISNGGAAPEKITDVIFAKSKVITQYKIARAIPDIDVAKPAVVTFGKFTVEVIDSTKIHVDLLKTIFDFAALKAFVSRPGFKLVFDAMHGVAGPSATAVFVNELGLPESSVINGIPKEDFGGGHPDPNLTYAEELVKIMGLSEEKVDDASIPEFGAAADGDADRNMILGKKFFVTPSDSLAIIAANARCIPYFKTKGDFGFARSMPTSSAVDKVGEKMGLKVYEVPTGWKYFGNLLDAGLIAICGEESFGTGSDHVREKDGLWAVLAWLSILEAKNAGSSGKFVSVEDIVKEHWRNFGRNYYTRYDYEEVDKDSALKMFAELRQKIKDMSFDVSGSGYELAVADEFSYRDPVDNSFTEKQGIRLLFKDGSRIIFRMSGTGSVGATVRMYIEQYEPSAEKIGADAADALNPLVTLALKISELAKFTGRDKPTVIT